MEGDGLMLAKENRELEVEISPGSLSHGKDVTQWSWALFDWSYFCMLRVRVSCVCFDVFMI